RYLRHRQRHHLYASGLGQREAAAEVEGQAAPQVRQGKGGLPVSTVGRADQVEQRLVVRDRQELPLPEHPTRRGEVPGEHADLADVWLCHLYSPPLVL